MKSEQLRVEGMHCNGCESRIRRVVGAMEGVAEVEPDHVKGEVGLRYDESKVALGELKARLERIGFEVL